MVLPILLTKLPGAAFSRLPFEMRAVRFHGRGDIRLDEIEEPVCGHGQVKVCQLNVEDLFPSDRFSSFKIKPAFVGICGSGKILPSSIYEDRLLIFPDLHEYIAGPNAVPTEPHPLTGEKLPTTLGHEFSGTIEEVGAGVTGLEVGDKVAIKPNLSDGTCRRCSMGRSNCCDNMGFIGYSGKPFSWCFVLGYRRSCQTDMVQVVRAVCLIISS